MFDKALLSLPYIKQVLGLLTLLALVQAAGIVGQAILLATAITNLWEGQELAAQTSYIAGFFGCFFARQLAIVIQDAQLSRYAAKRTAALRSQLLQRSFQGQAGWVRANGTARVTTSALDGIDQVDNYLRIILPKVVEAGAILPITLVAAFVLDWVSGIILLIVVPVLVFYMILLGRMAQERAQSQYSTFQRLSNHFIDTLRGLPTLKVFGASKRHVREIFETSEDFRKATVRTLRVATLSGVVLDLLATLGVAAVAMMLGFRLVVGQMDLFTGLAALILAPEYFAPLRQFAGDFHASLDGRNALADILKLTEGEEEELASSEVAPWNAESKLSLEGVCFTYPLGKGAQEGQQALFDLTFSAQGFRRIGIVGASGSGKSTLANLLGGFHLPNQGQVMVDGTALPHGLSDAGWQRQVLYIPQEPYLFHASLRDNVSFYTPEASDQEIERAISTVGLDELVAELPEGIHTIIGEGGRSLSGGQAHRIALARALLDDSRRILIFDEPTAHLDIETEYELKQRMLPLMEDHLVFFATHRLHWLQNMDYVLVLDEGRIVEQGAPADLLERDGALARLVSTTSFANDAHLRQAAGSESLPEVAAQAASHAAAAPAPAAAAAPAPATAAAGAHDDEARAAQAPEKPAKGADTWVRPYFSKYSKTLARAIGLGVGTFAFASLLMFTSGYLISATGEAYGSILYYYLPIALVQVFGLGKPLLHYFERLSSHDWVFRMTSSLRVRLYKALEQRTLTPAGSRRAGEVLGLVAEDIGHIQNLYLRTIFPLIIAWILLAIILVALSIVDLALAGAITLLFGLVAVVMPLLSARLNRKTIDKRKQATDRLYADLTDDMLGASEWVFAGRGDECSSAVEKQTGFVQSLQAKLDIYTRWNTLLVNTIMGATACLILVWAANTFGGPVTVELDRSANWIAAFVLALFPLIEAFSPLSAAATQANTYRSSINHLNEFPETDDSLDIAEDPLPANSGTTLSVDGLCFAYPGTEKLILDKVSFEVSPGQRIAILGRSGSGKSTLAALIRGDIEPAEGSVQIGGVDASTYGDSISQVVGVVQQSAYLFNRSLRENLTIGAPEASDEQIWEALEHVRLANMVRQLPDGLDTMADEAGARFSGGERHRIALARVLLANTPIILLDEPTVGLDPITEHELLETLLEATAGKTLIMITHHLQGVAAFDQVIFLEDGKIDLDGSPTALMQTSERYRQLISFDRGEL